jgi:hypothetical protein
MKKHLLHPISFKRFLKQKQSLSVKIEVLDKEK